MENALYAGLRPGDCAARDGTASDDCKHFTHAENS
jgi:hypothetical protein